MRNSRSRNLIKSKILVSSEGVFRFYIYAQFPTHLTLLTLKCCLYSLVVFGDKINLSSNSSLVRNIVIIHLYLLFNKK